MTRRNDLLDAVASLEAALRQSAELADDLTQDNRRAGVEFRRLVGEKVARIGSIGEEAFDDPLQKNAFRHEFSKLRSSHALHQASWPMVTVEPHNAAYIASLKAVRERNSRFIDWVRSELAP